MTEGKTDLTGEPDLMEQAFNLLAPEMKAVRDNDVLGVNVDVARVTAIVLGATPGIFALREQLAYEFPRFDFQRFDRLELYAWCLQHTQTMYLTASRKSFCPASTIKRGVELRTELHSAAKTLASRGLLDGTRLRNISSLAGYLNLSTDLQILTTVFREAWPTIEGRCAVTATEMRTAAELSQLFVQASSLMEKTPENIASAKEWRRRAFTILHKMYSRVRIAVLYVRLDYKDGEAIAPSLFSFRKPRGAAQPEASTEPPPPPEGEGRHQDSPFMDVYPEDGTRNDL